VAHLQRLFKATQERDIADKEQLIAAVEEINSASAPEAIRIPHPRCAAKGVKKSAVLTMFGDLSISRGLRLRHENNI
jgi:hypothetical protein